LVFVQQRVGYLQERLYQGRLLQQDLQEALSLEVSQFVMGFDSA